MTSLRNLTLDHNMISGQPRLATLSASSVVHSGGDWFRAAGSSHDNACQSYPKVRAELFSG